MKRIESSVLRTLVAVAALASVSAVHAADAFDVEVADIGLLMAREVQNDMKVTEAQRKKLNTHAEWFNTEANKVQDAYRKQVEKSPKSPPKYPADKITNLTKQLKSKVIKELSTAQVKRLREITIQQAGYLALMDDAVAKKVGLSSTQLKQLRDRFTADEKRIEAIQKEYLTPVINKYKDKKPASEAEAKKLNDQMQKDMQAAQKKAEPRLKTVQSNWFAFIEKTLTKTQMNAFGSLKGRTFKP